MCFSYGCTRSHTNIKNTPNVSQKTLLLHERYKYHLPGRFFMVLCHFQKQFSGFSSGNTRGLQKNACLIPHCDWSGLGKSYFWLPWPEVGLHFQACGVFRLWFCYTCEDVSLVFGFVILAKMFISLLKRHLRISSVIYLRGATIH